VSESVRVGNVEIVSIMDVPEWKLPDFFPSADPQVWESYRAIYPDSLCDGNSICTTATAYLVRANGLNVLIDTGLGPGPHLRIGGHTGRLLQEFQALGLDTSEVDIVVITHLHFDHVGWNAQPAEHGIRPTFPRARYLIPQADWDHFRRPEIYEKSKYVWDTVALWDPGVIDLVSGEQSVTPQITLVPTPGHTPGHQAVFVTSQGETAAIIGDLAHTPAQVQETDWSPSVEFDPELSGRTRRRIFDRVEAERILLCAGHFPRPGFGYLTRLDGRRLYRAAQIG
jgi:glyoxylase-like metal-dependent hydrolase (beta-lactamase superfamily II)